jgi:hypothetical protein
MKIQYLILKAEVFLKLIQILKMKYYIMERHQAIYTVLIWWKLYKEDVDANIRFGAI